MAAASILVGAVLTFGSVDGQTLQLTVSLVEPATVALAWGDLERRTFTAGPHTFTDLPAPQKAPLRYTLTVGEEPPSTHEVRPIGSELTLALYGDSRGGGGPHAVLIEQMAEVRPDVVVHTGDVIKWAGDRTGWTRHLVATLPLTAEVPVVLALGNHELFEYWRIPEEVRRNPLEQAMRQIPPPEDPIAVEAGVFPACFHVRLGRTLIVSLDSNRPIGPGTDVFRFLERALTENADAAVKLVAMHHGPLSSGHHGGHPEGEHLLELAKRHGITAFLAGHDHLYERIVQDGLTVVVSGGGGAPLYRRENYVPGSQAFSSTYNWVKLDVSDQVELSAYSLEGVLLDRARIPPAHVVDTGGPWALPAAGTGICLFLVAFGLILFRVVLGRSR